MVLERFIMETGLLPAFKFDLFGIGSLAQAGVNAAATAANNAVNAKIARETNAANVAMNAATNRANVAINEQTNATNRAIADDANVLNYQMFNEQNEWNENMWEKQNEYNDPANQMQRLIDAGINPNMIGSTGSNPTGVANNLPQAAQFAGAQIATMNPTRLEAGHIDPYKIAFEAPDVLGALAQAAGIDKTMAETENINIENKFKPDLLQSEMDMNNASARQVKEITDDFVRANAHRMSMRKLDIVTRKLAIRTEKYNHGLMKQELKKRKAEFREWKDLSSTRKNQVKANLRKTLQDIITANAEVLHMKAQEAHWSNQDELGKLNIDVLRQGLAFQAVDAALKSCGLRADTREKLAASFAQDPSLSSLSQLLEGLDMAADGNYNTWMNATMHNPEANALFNRLTKFLNSMTNNVPNDVWE